MDDNNSSEFDRTIKIMEYLDMIGTKPGFYIERKPKFYSVLGGVLSISSICLLVIIFIIYSLKDFEKTPPNIIYSSIPSVGYNKIELEDEKIWIPMRIIDYYYNFVNHEGLIYPVINYCLAERLNYKESFHCTKKKRLEFKLCNETSMINNSNIYLINTPLDKLYCINMNDLVMGGFWDDLFLGYVKINLYFCKNGENFERNNTNCTSYDKIKEKIGYNNSLELEIYYPTIQFQPLNYNNPIVILYTQNFYQISKYSNKIDRLFLQNYMLIDEKGWFRNNKINNSYWGVSSINADYYATPITKDLINEGSTSRFYSLNIYLKSGIILYQRKYKNFLSTLLEKLPLIYIIFIIFQNTAKVFKLAEENKVLIKLLFENIRETRIKQDKKFNIIKVRNSQKFEPSTPYRNRKIKSDSNFFKFNGYSPSPHMIKKKFNSIKNFPNLSFKEKKIRQKSIDNFDKKLMNRLSLSHGISKQNEERFKDSSAMNLDIVSPCDTKYASEKLFPYIYYIFSVFIKNLNLNKNKLCFSEKFAKVYTFLTKIMDIRSYLFLIKEFNVLRTKILNQRKINFIKVNRNINTGTDSFFQDIDNLERENLRIFTQGKFNK